MMLSFSARFVFQANPHDCRLDGFIRLRVRCAGITLLLSTGHCVARSDWEASTERVRARAVNSRGLSAAAINADLNRIAISVEDALRVLVAEGIEPPARQELRDIIVRAMGRSQEPAGVRRTFADTLREFMRESAVLNGWSLPTVYKFRTFGRIVDEYAPRLAVEDINENWMRAWMLWLLTVKRYHNETVKNELKLMRWVMTWALRKGYVTQRAADGVTSFHPSLRTVLRREVVYLDRDELQRIIDLDLSGPSDRLRRARDFFVFLCGTGLRFSDAIALRHEDITDGVIHCVNHKTGQTVHIELNHYSRSALAPYVNGPEPLPRISNQRLNDYVKELGYLAGIDQPVTRTWYVGGQRHDEVLPKYRLLGTHTGRRTFICLALQLGIPPTTVMQWTGHSGYKAMQPYISASSAATARAMRRFDEEPAPE